MRDEKLPAPSTISTRATATAEDMHAFSNTLHRIIDMMVTDTEGFAKGVAWITIYSHVLDQAVSASLDYINDGLNGASAIDPTDASGDWSIFYGQYMSLYAALFVLIKPVLHPTWKHTIWYNLIETCYVLHSDDDPGRAERLINAWDAVSPASLIETSRLLH